MALIKCPECGKEVSDQAESCPNCGYGIRKNVKTDPIAEKEGGWTSSPAQQVSKAPDIKSLNTKEKNENKESLPVNKTKEKTEDYSMKGLLFIFFGMFIGTISKILSIILVVVGIYNLVKTKKNGCKISALRKFLCVILLFMSVVIWIIPKDGKDEKTVSTSVSPTQDVNQEQKENTDSSDNVQTKKISAWEEAYKDVDVRKVDLKFAYKNIDYYKGTIIMTVGKVESTEDGQLKFDTNSKNFFFEYTCTFKDDVSGYKVGDRVCFIGKVNATHKYFGTKTVDMSDCYVVESGNTNKYDKQIKSNAKREQKYIEKCKDRFKKNKKAKAKKNKNNYLKKCKAYSYKKIQRQPNKFKDKYMKVSGKVIQVSEGWFDSVTLRVEDASGNIWYVEYTYSKKENKILENDKVTCYGKCTGTESYVSILGNKVTIPALDAEYIK